MPMPQYNGPTYGYNPYQTYLPQSPWQGPQPYTQPQTAQLPVQQVQTQANPPLVGHIVTANDQIPVSEVPQNGTPAYFPMQDGSSILAKSWQPDGTIATVRYIPEVQQSQPQEPSQQDVQGMDMMINMIHHLAEAEKCCWEACYYKTVVKAMKEGDDREDRDEDEDDDEEWIEHDDMPNRNRTSSGRFRRGNTVGRRYPGNERRDWGGDMGSDGGTIQHGDMTTMTPDEQLNHLKMDVETMWRDATPEQRKRIKESLTKWSTTLTV